MRTFAEGFDVFHWLRRFVEPHESVSGREARRRARYTALCFVLLVPLGLVAVAISLIAPDPSSSGLEMGAMLGGLVLLLVLYPLSRGPRYALASHVAIAIVSVGIWVPWLAGNARDVEVLYFACIPIIMGGLLLGPMSAAVIALGNVAIGFAVAPILVLGGGEPVGHAFTVPFFLLFVGGFAVNAAHLRERDLREVEELARDLAEHEQRRVTMLNNIAHDLSSPLTPIKLQLAMVPSDKPLPAARLDIMRRNLRQMERLVDDIKDLARLEDGGFKLHARPVDVAELVRSAVASFEGEAASRGLRFETDLHPTTCTADPERLTQVVYNLITNALKFTPEGGTVRLRAWAEHGTARVAVADTGRGLDEAEGARLFQPFVQVHERSEAKERGTGLGLYISRGIMRAHGGDLRVASEGRGKGAVFTLEWPSAPA